MIEQGLEDIAEKKQQNNFLKADKQREIVQIFDLICFLKLYQRRNLIFMRWFVDFV